MLKLRGTPEIRVVTGHDAPKTRLLLIVNRAELARLTNGNILRARRDAIIDTFPNLDNVACGGGYLAALIIRK